MPYPAFTGGVGNIKPSVFFGVYVKDTTSNKYQTLGAIAQGVLDIEDFDSPDSLTRNIAIGSYNFTAKCRMMQSSVTESELMDSLCNGTNSFLFKTADAVGITGSPVASVGWVEVTAAQANCTANLVLDGTPENNRYIEIEWTGSILKSDANEVLLYTPTLSTANFASSADSATAVFYGIGTYTAALDGGNPKLANIGKCGVSTLTFDLAGGSSPVAIGPVTDIKASFKMLGTPDSLRRPLPLSMDIALDISCMATLNADLLLLGNMSAVAVKIIMTMIDGLVLTLDNQVGIKTNYSIAGDMDKPRLIKFTHKGKVLQSTFDSIVS
jgi:hypothetical protein